MPATDACPACGGNEARPWNHYGPRCLVGDYHITTGTVANVWCVRCGLGWNRLMMSGDELSAFYGSYTKKVGDADEDDLLFGTSDADVETLTDHQAQFVAAQVTAAEGRVLDIGCGKGSFLRAFKKSKRGWQCAGVEPSREEAAIARRDQDLQVHEGMFGEVPLPPGSFDLVAIMHVLEHVPQPVETLRQMREVLKPGGLLFIEVPNTLDANMFYDVLLFEHLTHFAPATLAWLLQREGFAVVVHEASTPYGAQRIIARKSEAARLVTWPEVEMAAGAVAWNALWASMSALAQRGADLSAQGRRVAIFGAGMTAATWLVYTALHEATLVGLFDESPWKIGRTLFDRPIFALADIREHAPEVVLMATMPRTQQMVAAKLAAACAPGTRILGFASEQIRS